MLLILALQLVPDGAAVEKVAGGFGAVDGPTADGDGAIWFCDVPQRRILRFDGREVRAVREGDGTLAFDAEGRLVVCETGRRRIARIEGDEITELASAWNGEPLEGPSDPAIDEGGGIYFIAGAVFFLSPKGTLDRFAGDLSRPNGIALSADGKALYVADADAVLAFEIEGRTRRVFVEAAGRPDGMTVDSKGRLYAACDDGIRAWSADGKLVTTIAVPERPSNCTFYANVLYITAGTSLYRIKLNAEGR